MDGIPSDVRDDLNRDYLDETLADMEENGEAGEARFDANGNLIFDGGSDEWQAAYKLKHGLGEDAGTSDQYLLGFEPDEGDRGRVIVSAGNPDTADNVATLVPGTGTDWTDGEGHRSRANTVQSEAERVEGGGETAVISWIGYDPPGWGEAPFTGRAEEGAEGLSDFQDGLRATQQGAPSNNTVVGHSYGSTVIGHALQNESTGYAPVSGAPGLDADRVIAVGSPGMNASHVSELNMPGSKVHIGTGGDDIISRTPESVHGVDPNSEEFGATRFDAGENTRHEDYFSTDQPAVSEMAVRIVGD